MTVFNEILNVIRKGDFRPGTGWEGSGIGWIYGGQTIQGVLPFYFAKKAPPKMSKEVDGKLYDNYGYKKWANATMEEIVCQKRKSNFE